ncbi:S1C family serine protease [Ornithobacterium rhinotracheale]|uniref:Trypsin-like serine protease with C-terminal PDZ domain n=1 Tax=Ornithobacterium rhinotracheale (strain ATCC 51463 / DSM 15997 / CCUG 23171 / CIP 104009 / LMG 9086) TaxID=867902 RepID=I3ZZX6_ORNRL|nr:S1C family serine protease [Ornithobacterium rhinotracheale]AFL97260.1 trypsin-like serine protease with C-terminal PDZ domain [Ornithobacterium rhinotracheale DSM 15997]MBN3662431.1 serine protease [Ornithobacterium rhinotracheale]MCK0194153.1 S1C family serine protease [Ornithobacterium rhinotracheale]MCK0199717.1 S1C family serine protease [Ornithobacterium rhinotracheale]UOH64323.1 S1C family serine protease [Ornithobacterium rhinotracheale]
MKKLFVFFICSFVILVFASCENKRHKPKSLKKNEQTPKIENENSSNDDKISIKEIKDFTPDIRMLSGKEIFDRYNSAVFMIVSQNMDQISQGSGFFISEKGIGVSNQHVLNKDNLAKSKVILSNNEVYGIERIVYEDKKDDLVIFVIDDAYKEFNFLPMTSNEINVGDKVYAISSPLGLRNTLSSGEISQFRGENLIQISVPIDHGSSGGALINQYGEVIGVTTAGRDDSGANLNFAINLNKVLDKIL